MNVLFGWLTLKIKRTSRSHCLLCGKKLHNKKSRALGMGPVCLRKVNQQAELEAQGQMRLEL